MRISLTFTLDVPSDARVRDVQAAVQAVQEAARASLSDGSIVLKKGIRIQATRTRLVPESAKIAPSATKK